MPKINTNINLRRPKLRDTILCVLLLLASRSSVLGMYPFGITFFAACFDKTIAYLGFFIISIGLVLSGASAYIMKYLISTLLFAFFIHINKKKNIKTESVICACSVFMGGAIYHFCFMSGIAGLILALIEAVLSGIVYIIFTRADTFLFNPVNRTSIARDELISVALTLGILITGLKGVGVDGVITLSGIASIYIIMCISYHCGLSAAGSAGVGIGFICSMSSLNCVSSGGFYGICALFGSLLKGFGKYGAAVGFLGGAAAALIYAKLGTPLDINPFDVVTGAMLFTLTPEKIHSKINIFITKSIHSQNLDTGERIRLYLSDRLKSVSTAFTSLEAVFKSVSDKRIKNLSTEAADLFDETARRVCRGCPGAVHCFERDWGSTYKRLLSLLDAVEKDEEIPKRVCEECVRSTAFINEFYHVYELYCEKEMFKGEAIRSRDLSARLYKDVAGILSGLGKNVEKKIKFRMDYEDAIITELDKQGIILFEISVIEIGDGFFEVYLGLNSGAYIEALEETINEVTGSSLEFDGETDGITRFVTKPQISVSTAASTIPCEGCNVSGDCVEIFETEDHCSYVIISDGMGCGHDARNDSEGMTGLLKEFILSGFDVETAIKTVNSALCMQIERERSASVDVLCIDRVNRTAKMYKIGCAETVIKKGDKFDTVLPLSLPAGIIDEINAQPQNRRVQKGDIFIMASDGVTQCGGVFGDWIQNEISEEMSAQDIANKIMNRAVTKWNGAAFDDLTVVAVRIE